MNKRNASFLVDLVDAMVLRRSLPGPEERRALRTKNGLSQATIARAVGVSRSTVTRWENGARIPRDDDVLRRYHHVLVCLALYPGSLKGFEGEWGELLTYSRPFYPWARGARA